MKTFFRILFLLGVIGACYLLGRSQARRATTEVAKTSAASTKSAALSKSDHMPYFTTLEEIRALFADPNRSWDDKGYAFVYGLLPGINPTDIPAIIKLVADLPMPPNETSKNYMLRELFGALVKADPRETLSLIENYPNLNERVRIIGQALGTIAASDPREAFDLLSKLPPSAFDPFGTYGILFDTWAKIHPADAAAAALNLPLGFNRSNAIKVVADSWARSDPQASIQWVQSLGPSSANLLNETIGSALRYIAQNGTFDPQAISSYLSLVTDLSKRNSMINNFGATLSFGIDRNRGPAIDWLNQNASGAAYDRSINQIFSAFNNPGTLPAALDKINDPGAREVAIGSLAKRWAEINTTDALAWAQKLPDSDGTARSGALNTILTTLAKTNPTTAAMFIQNTANPSAYLSVAPTIAQQLAATDPQAALNWTNALPDGAEKNQALGSVLASMAQTDPTAAWNYANGLPEGSGRDTAMTTLVSSLAQKDPAQAVSLAEQMPAGSAQTNAIGSIAKVWVKQDPQTFTVWLNGLPAGDQRDVAVAQLVSSAQTAKNPGDVLAWANTVGNAQARAGQIEKVLTTWVAKDPEAALNAAQSVNLPDAQRAALVQKLTQAAAKK